MQHTNFPLCSFLSQKKTTFIVTPFLEFFLGDRYVKNTQREGISCVNRDFFVPLTHKKTRHICLGMIEVADEVMRESTSQLSCQSGEWGGNQGHPHFRSNTMFVLHKIMDGLFVGNKMSSDDPSFLITNKVEGIINTSGKDEKKKRIWRRLDPMHLLFICYSQRTLRAEPPRTQRYQVLDVQVYTFAILRVSGQHVSRLLKSTYLCVCVCVCVCAYVCVVYVYDAHRWFDRPSTIMFDPQGQTIKRMANFIDRIHARGCSVLIMSAEGKLASMRRACFGFKQRIASTQTIQKVQANILINRH